MKDQIILAQKAVIDAMMKTHPADGYFSQMAIVKMVQEKDTFSECSTMAIFKAMSILIQSGFLVSVGDDMIVPAIWSLIPKEIWNLSLVETPF